MNTTKSESQTPVLSIDEAERQSQTLLNDLRQLLATIDGPPQATAVEMIHQLATELLSVVKVIDNLRGQSAEAQAVIMKWRKDNSEKMHIVESLLPQHLKGIDTLIEGNRINISTLNNLLKACSDVISYAIEVSAIQQKIKTAADEEDNEQLLPLSEALGSTTSLRDKTSTQIESEINRFAGIKIEATKQTTKVEKKTDKTKEDSSTNANSENVDGARIPQHQSVDKPVDDGPSIPSSQTHTNTDDDNQGVDETREETEKLTDILAKALTNRQFGIAYHLTLQASNTILNTDAIKFIAMNYASDDNGSVTAEFSSIAASLYGHTRETLRHDSIDSTQRHCAVVLAIAAFRPAILAPGGPVAQFLASLKPLLSQMPALQSLASEIATISLQGLGIPLEMLNRHDSTDHWNARKMAMYKKIDNWLRAEEKSRLVFSRATKVWHKLLSSQIIGDRPSIGWIFEQIKKSDHPTTELLNEVKATVEYLKQHNDKEIDRIDRSLHPISSTRKIEGSARTQLRKKIDEAAAIVSEWSTFISSRSTEPISHQVEQLNRLLHTVNENGSPATHEISELKSPFASCARDLMHRYLGLFERTKQTVLDDQSISLRLLLHGDLLVDPQIEFDGDGEVLSAVSIPQLFDLASRDSAREFETAAKQRADRGDFHGSTLALEFAEKKRYISDDSADQIRIMIESIRETFERKIVENIRQTSDKLDATYALGALDASEVSNLRKGILSWDISVISGVTTFKPQIAELAKINQRIETAKSDRKKEMRDELLAIDADVSENDSKRIEDAISMERFLIAGEYIDRVKKGFPLPSNQDDPEPLFDRFFPTFVTEYSSLRDRASDIQTLSLNLIEQRRHEGPIDASRLSPDSAGDAMVLVKSWFALGDSLDSQAKRLSTLMTALGFLNVTVNADGHVTSSTHPLFELNSATISRREDCPLPDFGSRAEGRYRILVVHGKNTAEAVIQGIGPWSRDGEPPMIVIFANFLDCEQRMLLSSAFHSGEFHPTIVLDEALLMFVAVQGPERLRTFFHCATPFSFAQPFDPDATEVPPEMFVGRKSARKAILSRDGDCTHLVYGGRRLGKTALLADIAREFRGRENGVLVLLINLRGSGIGENKPTSEIWRLIRAELSANGVVGSRAVRSSAISEGVTKWLGESERRRILLLVDEADAFLDAERLAAPQYRELAAIKRLMEKTRRRFKVVFAGLHNVQRTARDPNTPLAHLGMPVQIGAMLPESDGGEIEQLILSPLKALGYRFTSRDSVTRIAAETNYYPALVQQFCKELLKDLRKNSDAVQEGPPYLISPEAVDRVFSTKETRDRIRDLFSWTIELDPRYKFLTYLIAWHCLDGSGGHLPLRGVPIDEIREDTLREWPQGFKSDDSFLTFEVLLDEMVGLGILSEEDSEGKKSFVIRSRNLRRLLGQIDEIERRLIDAGSEAAPAQFDPVHFRNSLRRRPSSSASGRHSVSKRDLISPLTAAQENTLLSYSNNVVFMFGTKLSGVDRIPKALSQLAERASEGDSKVFVRSETPSTVVGAFEKIKRQSAGKSGVLIYLVLVDCRDSDSLCTEQIWAARKEVSSNTSKNRYIRPIFLGGPELAWCWTSGGRLKSTSKAQVREVWLGPCTRDFARIWLRDRAERTYRDIEDADGTSDSLWPAVVEAAVQGERIRTIREAVRHVVQTGSIDLSDALRIEGLEQPLRLLASSPSETVDHDDLTALLSDLEEERDGIVMSREQISNLMEWSHDLGIVRRDSSGYHMDGAWATGIERSFDE